MAWIMGAVKGGGGGIGVTCRSPYVIYLLMMDVGILKQSIDDILECMPHKPFLCLPLSALLYVDLRDNHEIDARLVTGDLSFEDEVIFKQDFRITEVGDGFRTWAGHAWVKVGDLICDLSIFRTIYSTSFTKTCKLRLIEKFGLGRGCLVGTSAQMQGVRLNYKLTDILTDEMAMGVIKGIPQLLADSKTND